MIDFHPIDGDWDYRSSPALAQEPKVTPLMSKDLAESPGREALMITVEHAPGGSSAIHRHNAHAFVYVLEGSVVMQLKGGQEVTLTPGRSFYEGPADVHVVDRNASATQPAKFLVLLIAARVTEGRSFGQSTKAHHVG